MASGLTVTVIAMLLPYRLRVWFAYVLNFIFNRPASSVFFLFDLQKRMFNFLALLIIYFVGFGISKPIAMIFGGGSLKKKKKDDNYWLQREELDSIIAGMENPF